MRGFGTKPAASAGAPSGVEMMVKSLVRMIGLDPEKVMAAVEGMLHVAKSADDRLGRLETAQAETQELLRQVLSCLPAGLPDERSITVIGKPDGASDGAGGDCKDAA